MNINLQSLILSIILIYKVHNLTLSNRKKCHTPACYYLKIRRNWRYN
ncbi:unknown [Crocosphaera subtropica ATCC 51142]|uniref:Uncharacterized protein n=1 Tax=Crocosphaera subtropica (strain ATCC 51142 / BH68) TaxID=43989 RepID=B1X0R7_CROS5|nr:unknown [Crocosphaera subtropica ATCC 51142]